MKETVWFTVKLRGEEIDCFVGRNTKYNLARAKAMVRWHNRQLKGAYTLEMRCLNAVLYRAEYYGGRWEEIRERVGK